MNSNASKIYKSITEITTILITNGLAIDCNSTILMQASALQDAGNRVCWNTDCRLSNFFELGLYEQYIAYLKEREYTLLLKDYSIIQMSYDFDRKDKLIKHRLLYFPSPLEELVIHDMLEVGCSIVDCIEVFADCNSLLASLKAVTPIRFDFDADKMVVKDTAHPMSHITVNGSNCRIPLYAPVTPYEFIDFILLNFYDASIKIGKKYDFGFEKTITNNESKLLHVRNMNQ